jgi:DHA1 family bicyclomycin/chloramphenicol resistance-like MFS transporter
MSFVTLALQLPSLLAPAIGGVLVVYAGWQSLFLLLAAVAVILFVLAYQFLPETRPDAQANSPALSRVFSDYARLARNPQFATSAGIIALTAAAAMTLLTVFPAALTDLFGKSPDVVGYYTSAYSLISILGALASAQLVARLGVGRLMASVLGAAAIYLAGYLVWSQVFSFTLTNLFVSVSVVGFSQSIIVSMGFARAVDADEELRGTASGFAGAFASIVSAGFAAAGASVYAFGLSMSLGVVLGCFLLSSGICGVLVLRDRRGGEHISRGDSG